MLALTQTLGVLAVLADAVIYGTDVFGALVQRPALAAVDDATLTRMMGSIHRVADRRLAVVTIGGLLLTAATAVSTAIGGHAAAAIAAGIAALAVLAFMIVYLRISKPINTALTAASVAGETPADARALQARWDSVIDARALLLTVAVAGLCIALITA